MRFLSVLLALVVACQASVSDIAGSFDAELNSGKNLFVKFYAPW
jgi:hypothetical protein